MAQVIAKYKPHAVWPRLLIVLGASLVLFGLSFLLKRPCVVGRDRAGNEITRAPEHSLYWIPLEYWSVVVLLFGSILVFAQFGR